MTECGEGEERGEERREGDDDNDDENLCVVVEVEEESASSSRGSFRFLLEGEVRRWRLREEEEVEEVGGARLARAWTLSSIVRSICVCVRVHLCVSACVSVFCVCM